LKLVVILWEDHSRSAKWIEAHDLENEVVPFVIRSVGWLVHETSKCYGLAATVLELGDEVCSLTTILKTDVLKKWVLRVSDAFPRE